MTLVPGSRVYIRMICVSCLVTTTTTDQGVRQERQARVLREADRHGRARDDRGHQRVQRRQRQAHDRLTKAVRPQLRPRQDRHLRRGGW